MYKFKQFLCTQKGSVMCNAAAERTAMIFHVQGIIIKDASRVSRFGNNVIQKMIEQFQDLAFTVLGSDKVMSFTEMMNDLLLMIDIHVKSLPYLVTIFDTALTDHTLHFFLFPTVLEKALGISRSCKRVSFMFPSTLETSLVVLTRARQLYSNKIHI
ncbi:hypothetical protein EDC04DRAFT_2609483 [Pisolithus marmoratus]|nr:hypothetical protein EDC04DRAFT_2609483 [Pisolithus marmoratus]